MRIRRRAIPLMLSLGFVATGCGVLPDFLLEDLRPTAAEVVKNAVQSAVEDAVQNAVGDLLGSLVPSPIPPTTSQPAP